jgi:hypothetical protein
MDSYIWRQKRLNPCAPVFMETICSIGIYLCLICKYYLRVTRATTNITIGQYILWVLFFYTETPIVYFNTDGPKNNLPLNMGIYPSSYYKPFPVNPLSGR